MFLDVTASEAAMEILLNFPVAVETPLWVLSFAIFIFAKRVFYPTPSLVYEKNKWLKRTRVGVSVCLRAFGIALNEATFACVRA